MKLVVLDGNALNPGDLSWAQLERFGHLTVYHNTPTQKLAIERAREADILFTNKTPITPELLDACPRVRLVNVLATGYNVVDCEACRQRNIPVCNIPAYGTAAVAQFAFALILELVNGVGIHDRSVHAGDWEKIGRFSYWLTPQMELAGKTLGIIGLGRIGSAVAAIGKAFGMEVIAYSRTPRQTPGITMVTLPELLQRSHIVSLHCPLFPQTERIINENTLAQMRKGAFLVNTSRGGLVDEAALVAALESGHLAGAALDVVSTEPIPSDHILLKAPNCILTPHMAWSPLESRQRILDVSEQNLENFLAGHPIHVVN